MKTFLVRHFSQYARALEIAIHSVIVVSLVALCLQTVSRLPDWAYQILNTVEGAALIVFVIEYGVRIIVADHPKNYILSFWGIIDLLAIAPAIAAGSSAPYFMRSVRLLRLMRILKLALYSHALQRLACAFQAVKAELAAFCFLSLIVFFIAAAGIYYFENEAQPDKFSSIPASLWWAIATLTTVGYGDIYPITPGGKLFSFFILMIGLGLVAVPAGLIASALTNAKNSD